MTTQTSTKRNEHPGCTCWACQRGKRKPGGKFLLKQVQKKIRRLTKQDLNRWTNDNDLIVCALISTPYTD